MATQMFKIKKIKEAIKDKNVNELRNLAIKHGFINNKLRKQAWPILLGIKKRKKISRNRAKSVTNTITNTNTSKSKYKLSKRRSLSFSNVSNKSNYDQIEKDIARSALNFYNLSEEKKQESRTNLGRILHSMFDESEQMHYIQGFNDVVSVFYAVCGDNLQLSKLISERVAKTLLSDYIMNGSSELNFTSLQLIFKMISYHDIELSKLFSSIEQAHLLSFAVSWLLTWFAHEIKEINIIARIYDYCLSLNNKQISLYLSTALLIYFKKQLLLKVNDDVSLHCFFQQLKWSKIDFNKVIYISQELFHKYPPNIISPYSPSYSDINIEIKEEINDNSTSDNESEYNSDLCNTCQTCNTPSLNTSECDFDVNDNNDNNNHNQSINNKKISGLSIKINLPNVKFFDSIQSIPDTITSFIDETVSLFDKK